LFHLDLKTAFLQGEMYDKTRDVICQLPPEAGHPPHIGARMKKPAYGLNDAPRRWWNIIDGALLKYGSVPTRADRCCYVVHSLQKDPHKRVTFDNTASEPRERSTQIQLIEDAIEYLTDPIAGSPSFNKRSLWDHMPPCR